MVNFRSAATIALVWSYAKPELQADTATTAILDNNVPEFKETPLHVPRDLGAARVVTEAPLMDAEKDCPFCAERIKAAAIKCKHCGSEIPATQSS